MQNNIVVRVLVCSVVVLLIIMLCSIGNGGERISTVNTNENTINLSEQTSNASRININEASQSALETLPGIDTKLAQDIIENRPYTSPWDLLEVDGIGENTVRSLLDYIEV